MTTLALIFSATLFQNHAISEVLPKGFESVSFTLKKVKANQTELKKINDDFGLSYRFSSSVVKLKEPFKLRMESKIEDTTMVFITNGTRKSFKAPRSNISIKENVAKAPGKRQTAFDFGLVTPAIMSDYLNAKFVRVDRKSNDYVYDMTYKPETGDTTKFRVWINPKMKVVTKREWYHQNDGRLMATFYYTSFVQKNGLYFPTEYTVYNADNKLAGQTKFESVAINSSIDDSQFVIK